MAGARLKERGVTNFRIIEAGGDFGGTWYWNRYPGAQCDIESYCYLPLLEETGYMPKEKYSFAPEIYEHTQRVGEYFGLYDNAIFQTRVTEVKWLDDARAGRCRRTATTASARNSSFRRPDPRTGRSCRAFPASPTSKATRSTRRDGTTTTPAATTTAG